MAGKEVMSSAAERTVVYEHRQWSDARGLLVLLLPLAGFVLSQWRKSGTPDEFQLDRTQLVIIWLTVTSLLIVVLGGWMTIRVERDEQGGARLVASVGLARIRRTIPLADVTSYGLARRRRFRRHTALEGRSFAVRGREGVRLVLKDGFDVFVGSDEPQALIDALRPALGVPRADC